MTNEALDITNKLIKPDDIPASDDAMIQQLSDNLQGITTEDVDVMCNEIDEAGEKRKEIIGKIKWNTDAIRDDLKKNYVKIEENAEMMWYKWKKVHITLPSIWSFEWYKFGYFISDNMVKKWEFENNPNLGEKSLFSMCDISKLLQAINKYMVEFWGKNDMNVDYENELQYWRTKNYRCNAWDCLRTITWLCDWYWLSDKDVAWRKDSHAIWYCFHTCCYFNRSDDDFNYANLILRISD